MMSTRLKIKFPWPQKPSGTRAFFSRLDLSNRWVFHLTELLNSPKILAEFCHVWHLQETWPFSLHRVEADCGLSLSKLLTALQGKVLQDSSSFVLLAAMKCTSNCKHRTQSRLIGFVQLVFHGHCAIGGENLTNTAGVRSNKTFASVIYKRSYFY